MEADLLARPSAANEKPKTKANWDAVPYGCLVRATDGKKKVSTLLGPKDVLRFQDAYDTILKVSGCHLCGRVPPGLAQQRRSRCRPRNSRGCRAFPNSLGQDGCAEGQAAQL